VGSSLAERLSGLGHNLSAAQLERLDQFCDQILRVGARMNLVGRVDRPFIEGNLIGGSLELARLAPLLGRVVDVGSGAGFPGIPLAVMFPDSQFELVEVRKKRVAFLEQTCRKLKLSNVSIRMIDVGELVGESFDWAVSRAFRPPREWLETASGLLRPGGFAGLFTVKREWNELELNGWTAIRSAPDRSGEDRIVACLQLESPR